MLTTTLSFAILHQDVLSDIYGNPLPALEEPLTGVVDYLAEHPHISELILSGGDSLNVPLRHLNYLDERLLRLMDELYWTTFSWTNGVRLVMDTPIGKVRREDIVAWDEETGQITFQREGEDVFYHDFPAELDVPGDIKTLLWKR